MTRHLIGKIKGSYELTPEYENVGLSLSYACCFTNPPPSANNSPLPPFLPSLPPSNAVPMDKECRWANICAILMHWLAELPRKVYV